MSDPNVDLANIAAWAVVILVGAFLAFRKRSKGGRH